MTEPTTAPAGVDVAVEAVIRRPLADVAAFANEPSNAPEWYANISAVEWKTRPPLQVGTQVAFVARFLGRTMRYTYEIAEHTATSLVMRTADGPFPMETTYRFEPTLEGHTRMTLRNRGKPTGFSRLLRPFLAGAMRRANRKDLQALTRILEQ
jgi:hypothetical protein